MTNVGVDAYDFALQFDANVIVPAAAPIETVGTLSGAMSVVANSPQAGKLVVSAAGANYLSGQGTLLFLKFNVVGAPQSSSPLAWQVFQFADGAPCAAATNGRIAIGNQTGALSGTIVYGTTPANQSARPVRNAVLMAAGTPQVSATTDANGAYRLPNLGAGGYTVTPAKTGDVNGINSTDAARIQQYLVGLIALSPNQLKAADANNNGAVNSTDAARIQQYLVGIQSPNIIGQWKFVPASKQYSSVAAEITNENYEAILVGDVNGSWQPPASALENSSVKEQLAAQETERTEASSLNSPQNGIAVSLPAAARSDTGTIVTIPVTVGDLTGANIESFDFTLFYDPAVLQPASPVASNGGTLSQNCSVLGNSPTAGRVIVSAACGTAPLNSGQGTLLNLRFNVVGARGTRSNLTFANPQTGENTFVFNDGQPTAKTTAGAFVVRSPTAASATIGGQVTSAAGRAIRNARVTITDASGNARATLTNSFGHYQFAEVGAGASYVLSVTAKQFTFAAPTQAVTVSGDADNFNFVADN